MSQQVTKEKYSIETLRERNVSYDHQHWLTQKDVDMANNYVELIERTRSEITPQIGDRLVYVTEHGDYYGNALIDSRSAKEGYLSVCEQPYVPFVWEEDGNIRLSVSGGAFHSVNPEELKFLKWTEGVFKDWGHCGACANGSVSFLAKVPLWFYAEPNPRYGDFTTETYRKFYLHKREESENGNLYQGFDIAFRDEAEFRQFLKYLKVCFCTNVNKSSSGIRSNLSVSSIPVLIIQTLPLESSVPEVDFTPGLTINLYDDKTLKPPLGVTDTFFSCRNS